MKPGTVHCKQSTAMATVPLLPAIMQWVQHELHGFSMADSTVSPPPPPPTPTHPAAKAVEATHQILKSIVTASINEVPELQRYVNLKSEILAHSAVTLDKYVVGPPGGGGGCHAVW